MRRGKGYAVVVDEGLQRMLDVEFDKVEPILKQTLLERAPTFGVGAETQRALRELPEGRYTRAELMQALAVQPQR